MKITKKQLAVTLVCIAVLVVSLVITLLDALVPLKIWVHPALTFLFCLCVGFGVLLSVLGFARKSVFYFFLSAILLGLALVYALSNYIDWWIGVIVVAVVWAIFGCVSFIANGNRTEDIALNKSPDYKDYKQRKAEKEAAEQAEEKKELPEIKSFKD